MKSSSMQISLGYSLTAFEWWRATLSKSMTEECGKNKPRNVLRHRMEGRTILSVWRFVGDATSASHLEWILSECSIFCSKEPVLYPASGTRVQVQSFSRIKFQRMRRISVPIVRSDRVFVQNRSFVFLLRATLPYKSELSYFSISISS